MPLIVILILVLLTIAFCASFSAKGREWIRAITPYVRPFAFSLVVLGIALFTWLMRTLVESDPDPFFLNLTFFAFAGQCIRTGEFMLNKNRGPGRSNLLLFLLVFALLMVVCHVFVLKAHMRTTMNHYQELLTQNRKGNCSDHDIEHWSSVLLHVTGTDFFPGSYRWLKVFPLEPRAKSRIDGFSILPETHFRKAPSDANGFTPESLAVPLEEREWLWHLYWITCLCLWVSFVTAIWMSHRIVS